MHAKHYKTAIIIGRFQPLHRAHLEIIEKALEQSEQLIIVIGSCAKPRTIKNPWTAEERKFMIKSALFLLKEKHPDYEDRIDFITVRDYMYNGAKWVTEVFAKSIAVGATHDKQTCLFGCFKDDSSYYLNMFPRWDLRAFDYMYDLDATDIREGMFLELLDDWKEQLPPGVYGYLCSFAKTDQFKELQESYEFIKEYPKKWGNGPFITTDAVVVKSGHVLMIERANNPGRGLLALPGGFLNNNERIIDGCIRELEEETNIQVDGETLKHSIECVKVFDHPQRDPRGRIVTHAHLINLGSTGGLPCVEADDDAARAIWVPLADLSSLENQLYSDHFDIIFNLTSRF